MKTLLRSISIFGLLCSAGPTQAGSCPFWISFLAAKAARIQEATPEIDIALLSERAGSDRIVRLLAEIPLDRRVKPRILRKILEELYNAENEFSPGFTAFFKSILMGTESDYADSLLRMKEQVDQWARNFAKLQNERGIGASTLNRDGLRRTLGIILSNAAIVLTPLAGLLAVSRIADAESQKLIATLITLQFRFLLQATIIFTAYASLSPALDAIRIPYSSSSQNSKDLLRYGILLKELLQKSFKLFLSLGIVQIFTSSSWRLPYFMLRFSISMLIGIINTQMGSPQSETKPFNPEQIRQERFDGWLRSEIILHPGKIPEPQRMEKARLYFFSIPEERLRADWERSHKIRKNQ